MHCATAFLPYIDITCILLDYLLASHWIRIASIVIYLVLQSTPTHVMAGSGYSAIAPVKSLHSNLKKTKKEKLWNGTLAHKTHVCTCRGPWGLFEITFFKRAIEKLYWKTNFCISPVILYIIYIYFIHGNLSCDFAVV